MNKKLKLERKINSTDAFWCQMSQQVAYNPTKNTPQCSNRRPTQLCDAIETINVSATIFTRNWLMRSSEWKYLLRQLFCLLPVYAVVDTSTNSNNVTVSSSLILNFAPCLAINFNFDADEYQSAVQVFKYRQFFFALRPSC